MRVPVNRLKLNTLLEILIDLTAYKSVLKIYVSSAELEFILNLLDPISL